MKVYAVLGLSLVAAACVTPPEERLNADGEVVECRRVETTGSRLGERVCMTETQWVEAEEAEREANEEFLRRSGLAGRNETAPTGMSN